jgi:hypothetical protein
MKRLGVITALALVAFLAISVVPAGAQSVAGTTSSSLPVASPDPAVTPAPLSIKSGIGLYPSLPPKASPAASSSSDSFHRFDFYAGYSFLSNEIAVVDDGDLEQLVHGYAASVTFNLNRSFGILADFSGHNGTLKHNAFDQTEDQYYFLFGPVVSHSFGKARISGHVGVGFAKQHYGENFGEGGNSSIKEYDFAVGAGGAFDWMFSDRWGWRVLQADYLMSDFTVERVHNFRASTGIIIRFK